MNKVEEITLEAQCRHILANIDSESRSLGDHALQIEYSLPYNARRIIKIDSQKNYVIIYTFDPTLVPDLSNKDRIMYYVACVNEGCSLTGLELNIQKGSYRYKSSQAFPRGVDASAVIRHFLGLHDAEFPKLRDSIRELQGSSKEPLEAAKEFIKSIKNS